MMFLSILASAKSSEVVGVERRSSIIFRGCFGGFTAKTTSKKEISRGPAAPKPPPAEYLTDALGGAPFGIATTNP
jgi:hypothetical protein